MSNESVLYLHSSGLLSKWGFNDGAAPDDVLDYCEERGLLTDAHGYYQPVSWRPILEQLVRRYLLPTLDQHVTVVHIETTHNPIRAETVDGVNVDDCWHDGGGPELTPESVTIPMAEVAALIPADRPPCGPRRAPGGVSGPP